jgi:dihydropteroate synthase
MGVLNATPDSFSDRGRFADLDAALAKARRLIADGADIVDVGGESTRPGAAPVDEDEEIARVEPLIRALAAENAVRISVDTRKPAVACAAMAAGATIWNDVTALAHAPDSLATAAALGCDVVLMHMQGEPGTMQDEPRYDDVVAEVIADLRGALARAEAAGVAPDRLIVDPGFGFGKTPDHNLAVLAGLATLREALGRPVLLGTSRKSTLGRLLDLPVDQRVEATLATTALGVGSGVDIVRVHDVRENVRAARTADAVVRGWRPAGWTEA